MPALILRQTDDPADDGFDTGCSGLPSGATVFDREALEGGTAGGTNMLFVPTTLNVIEAAIAFQSDVDEPGETDWPIGDYVMRLEVVVAGSHDDDWEQCWICEREAGGTMNVVTFIISLGIAMQTTGVKTQAVNRGTSYTAAADSTLYMMNAFIHTVTHGSWDAEIDPSQNIDTPIIVGGPPVRDEPGHKAVAYGRAANRARLRMMQHPLAPPASAVPPWEIWNETTRRLTEKEGYPFRAAESELLRRIRAGRGERLWA